MLILGKYQGLQEFSQWQSANQSMTCIATGPFRMAKFAGATRCRRAIAAIVATRRSQKNQAPEDRHASNYSNDCSGWVRGARGQPTGNNETAENKPSGFDKGQSSSAR